MDFHKLKKNTSIFLLVFLITSLLVSPIIVRAQENADFNGNVTGSVGLDNIVSSGNSTGVGGALGSGFTGCSLGLGGIGSSLLSLSSSITGGAAGGSLLSGVQDSIGSGLQNLGVSLGSQSISDLGGSILNAGGGGAELIGAGFSSIPGVGAVLGGLGGGEVPVKDSVTNSNTAGTNQNTKQLVTKETCLDTIAYQMAKIVLRNMTQSVLVWINSGFNGEPLFITNPGTYFGNIATQELNRTITNIGNSGSIYANNQIRALLSPKAPRYDLGQKITQNCIARQVASASVNGSNIASNYQVGDYETRLAQTETNKTQGFLANVSYLSRRALALVGFSQLAQVGEADYAGGSGMYTCPVVDGVVLTDGTCIPPGGLESSANNPSNTNSYSNAPIICPTTPAAQKQIAQDCTNGTKTFSQCGGWNGFWLPMTQNSANTNLGAVLAAQVKANENQTAALSSAKQKADWAQGFLSVDECVTGGGTVTTDASDNIQGCEKKTTTPGIAVAEQLKQVIGSDFRQAELVNQVGQSVDQIINAVFNQFLNMGLSSLTSNNSVINNAANQVANGLRTQMQVQSSINNSITNTIANAKQYAMIRAETVDLTRSVASNLSTVSNEISSLGANYCPNTNSQAVGDIGKISQLNAAADSYQNAIIVLLGDIKTLQDLANKSSISGPEVVGDVTTVFNQISYRIPTSGATTLAQTELNQIRAKNASTSVLVGACAREKVEILAAEERARAAREAYFGP